MNLFNRPKPTPAPTLNEARLEAVEIDVRAHAGQIGRLHALIGTKDTLQYVSSVLTGLQSRVLYCESRITQLEKRKTGARVAKPRKKAKSAR